MVDRTVKSRKEPFVQKASTAIWQEQADEKNPYLTKRTMLRGYDFEDAAEQCDFVELFYLLFVGELPNADQKQLLSRVLKFFINPGPRHPATRTAMSLGAGKTFPQHILPIALGVAGGEYLGGRQVQLSMQFMLDNVQMPAEQLFQEQKEHIEAADEDALSEGRVLPGFGRQYGAVDPYAKALAARFLNQSFTGAHLRWAQQLVDAMQAHDLGWLSTSVMAAALCDLGFPAYAGAGLSQLMQAPGLLAHGLEYYPRPRTDWPFVKDEDYEIV